MKDFSYQESKEDMCMEKWLVRTVDYLETFIAGRWVKTLFHELKIWVYEEKSVIKIFYDNDRGGEARSGAFEPCFGTLLVLWTFNTTTG